jgi:hypothetical protein
MNCGLAISRSAAGYELCSPTFGVTEGNRGAMTLLILPFTRLTPESSSVSPQLQE